MTRAASTLADLPLFAQRSRTTDPASSHAAAARVQRAGIASAQRREALHFVALWPGHTASEIAALACGDDAERERLFRRLGRRLCELRDASPQRVSNGHTSGDARGLRWWIVEAQISDARLDG